MSNWDKPLTQQEYREMTPNEVGRYHGFKDWERFQDFMEFATGTRNWFFGVHYQTVCELADSPLMKALR